MITGGQFVCYVLNEGEARFSKKWCEYVCAELNCAQFEGRICLRANIPMGLIGASVAFKKVVFL